MAFSSRATGSSAWALLGLSGMGAIFGVHAYWVALGTVAGVAISWFKMGKPFKRLTDRYDSITVPDYLVDRFQARSPWLRIIAATALSVFVTIYVSAQIDATGTAFESFLGWNYYVGAIVGFLIVLTYVSFGGFVAVAWSDVFQGSLMLIGLVFMPVYLLLYAGGWSWVGERLGQIDPYLLNIWGSGGFSALNLSRAIGFLMIGLGYLGSPQLFVRYMAIRSEREIDRGKWVSVTLTLLMNVSAVTIGLLGRAIFTEPGQDPMTVLGNGGQEVLILSAESLLPGFVSALYITAILAAIMLTIDSLLVLASSAITRDFYQKLLHPTYTDRQLSNFSKRVTVALSFSALLIALIVASSTPSRTIFWFVIFGWSGIAATFCPVMLLSLFWPKFTEQGAITAMLIGFVSVPIFKFLAPQLPVVGSYFQVLAELFPAFFLSLAAGYLVSKSAALQKH